MVKIAEDPNLRLLQVDPSYSALAPLTSQLCYNVWSDKYRYKDEAWDEMAKRVSAGVFAKDKSSLGQKFQNYACEAIKQRLWMPAGRILAGAGTPKRVTLLNCFVNAELEDDMVSITQGLSNIMLTMQQGGGIGTDFSPLRPELAILHRTGSTASGPGPFIDTWDSACTTIRSAGDRRGAMMGTLMCSHPYLPQFITAKQTKGRWTNFNVSVLITDAFMGAVHDDELWYLHHRAEPAFDRPPELTALDFTDDDIDDGFKQFVYSVHKARDLWDQILRSTYDYAEPGVIFIDRVNDLNNLQPWEHIQCTNPCGEQPLPPHGCCDLGAVNVSRMVTKPHTPEATFNWVQLKFVVRVGVRFLDNVIDVTNYPLPEQRAEEFAKRRIGIGLSGLADAMHMLGMRYGNPASCDFAERVMKTIAEAAYSASIDLATEKGSAPIFHGTHAELTDRPFIKKLSKELQAGILNVGLRNGVLLTVAPTGTTSIAYDNISSGLEPVFLHQMNRKVRQGDGSWKEYTETAYGAALWLALNPGATIDELPTHMNVCDDVRVHEHIRIQEVCQKWVDASISKTINLPTEITYEAFKEVYSLAYESGCKGCTTYRPSDVRGSILSAPTTNNDTKTATDNSDRPQQGEAPPLVKLSQVSRPEIITGRTVKIKWPGLNSALYLTINYVDDRPYEVFLNSKDQKSLEWMMTTTILMSMALRTGIDLVDLAKEFQSVSALEGGWAPNGDGKLTYWPSLIAYLGFKMSLLTGLETGTPVLSAARVGLSSLVDQNDKGQDQPMEGSLPPEKNDPVWLVTKTGEKCDKCSMYAVVMLSGCKTCGNCGDSKCS